MHLQTSVKKVNQTDQSTLLYSIKESKEPQKLLHPEFVRDSNLNSENTKLELTNLVQDISHFQEKQISDYSEFLILFRNKTFQDNLVYFLKNREEFEKTSTLFNILKNKVTTTLIEKDIIDEKGWLDKVPN